VGVQRASRRRVRTAADLRLDHALFFAVVEAVLDGVVELTVTRGNRNARTPVFGKTLDIHQDKLRDLERWSLKSQADSEHEVVTA